MYVETICYSCDLDFVQKNNEAVIFVSTAK